MIFDFRLSDIGDTKQIEALGLLPGCHVRIHRGSDNFKKIMTMLELDTRYYSNGDKTYSLIVNDKLMAVWIEDPEGFELVMDESRFSDELPEADGFEFYFRNLPVEAGQYKEEMGTSLCETWELFAVFSLEKDEDPNQNCDSADGEFSDKRDNDFVCLPAPEWAEKLGDWFISTIFWSEIGLKESLAKAEAQLEIWEDLHEGRTFYGELSCEIVLKHGDDLSTLGTDGIGGLRSDDLVGWAKGLFEVAWAEVDKTKLGVIVA